MAAQWFEHQLDPRCHPDPTVSTVSVPDILDNESPSHYESCLATLGLTSHEETLSESDPDTADGAAAMTNPSAGTEVEPGSQVDVGKNPSVRVGATEDPRCKPQPPGDVGDPGQNPPGYAGLNPAYQLQASYPGSNPTLESRPPDSIELYWGTTRWGLRKIKLKHGYGEGDESDTKKALTNPPTGVLFASNQTWNFHDFYDVEQVDGGVLHCVRTVSVQYLPDRGQTQRKGITNSFSGILP
ncbi:MAG: hypothetical protein M3155_00890 [Actinomycetota bacterium]|nr:hypothetical protein [Actinomycetota bacterium]